MILQYRTFRSQLGCCNISITKQGIKAPNGQIMSVIERWFIRGELLYDNPTQIKNATLAMEAAFSQDGGDLIYFLADGRTPSAHALYSSQTLGGVKISQPPSFPDGDGIQCASYRSFVVELEAEKLATGANSNVVQFQESISVRGGGRRVLLIEKPLGEPKPQQVREQTICYVTQSGSATGLIRPPTVPQPLLPQYLVDEFPEVRIRSGRFMGYSGQLDQLEIPVEWSYEMQLPFRLTNPVPNVWTT